MGHAHPMDLSRMLALLLLILVGRKCLDFSSNRRIKQGRFRTSPRRREELTLGLICIGRERLSFLDS